MQQNKQKEIYVYGNQRISIEANDSLVNYVYDGRNNVVSKDGNLDKLYQYNDFGNVIQNVDDKYTYSNEYTEYDYQYLRARYYETTNGRFLSRDNYLGGSENAQEYNQYIYALNNPLKYQDPSGHWSLGDLWNGGKRKIRSRI